MGTSRGLQRAIDIWKIFSSLPSSWETGQIHPPINSSNCWQIQDVQQNWSHFVICNFSSPLTAWIKSNDIFEMPFKFSVGKCPKNLWEVIIWSNFDTFYSLCNSKSPFWANNCSGARAFRKCHYFLFRPERGMRNCKLQSGSSFAGHPVVLKNKCYKILNITNY